MRKLIVAFLAAAVGVVIGTGAYLVSSANDYEVKLVMPNAIGMADGTPLQVGGRDVGRVTGIEVKDDKAIVTASVEGQHAPLHSGTKTAVEWRSVLGERYIKVSPGPEKNPPLPSGALIQGNRPQVTTQDLLATLDGPTRKHVSSLVQNLEKTLDQREPDMNATLHTAGPTVDALGQVLGAVGEDGPAIRRLVSDVRQVTNQLSSRGGKLADVVNDLGKITGAAVTQQKQLASAVEELPSALSSAKETLDKVPAATDAAKPLLDDLAPATTKLKSVSSNLSPVLRDLRPTLAELRPTLQSANELLKHTPGFLDNAHGTLPDVTNAFTELSPAVKFLRPYTPEAVGWAANWGKGFSYYDAVGMMGKLNVSTGTVMQADLTPQGLPILMNNGTKRAPGANVDQPWTDANGDAPR